MSPALVAAGIWLLAASVAACMPQRARALPGLALAALAVPVVLWIGSAHGLVPGFAAALAAWALCGNPLRHLSGRRSRSATVAWEAPK